MLFEFECNNVLGFDPTSGTTRICHNKVVARADQIGEMVECTQCGQLVEVPVEAAGQGASSPSKRDKNQPAIAATKAVPSGGQRKPKESAGRRDTSADGLTPPSDIMAMEFGESGSQLRPTENSCPSCGAPLNSSGKCTQCRYVEQKFPSAYLPLDKIKMKPAGLQKYLGDILNEGVSTTALMVFAHVLVGLFTIIVGVAFFLIGTTATNVGLLILILGAAFYVGMVIKAYDLSRNPRAKLAWFQKPMWYGVLFLLRQMQWQKRRVINRRKAPLTDENLPELEELKTCQVLDLESTLITDSSLRHLYGHRHLQFLVLRKTKVTDEGVMRLQQANRDLWIWH